MSCCAPGAELCLDPVGHSDEEIFLASRTVQHGLRQTNLSVPDIQCGACLQTIEAVLGRLEGVRRARANLSTRRVTVFWSGDAVPPLLSTLKAIGYQAHLHDVGADDKDPALSQLLRALAVAGFASSNITLLSVSVWSGAEPQTRDLFHFISALIALPTLAYSGQVFFVSAWRSLSHGRTNMDVPISIGVLLTFGLSLCETIQHGPYAYFDATVSLLFVLLIGRTLEHVMRERARQAVSGLARLAPRSALVLQPDGTRAYVPVNEIEPGMTILLAAGERVPVNARVTKGVSALDCALVSGEGTPKPAVEGSELLAGVLNLTAPLELVATAAARDSFLAEMVLMMETAEAGRSSHRRIADRAARLYAPIVHATALLAFAGWMIATGDAHRAITVAIAVLIITCPCALGLAVPMVHVMAARRLFENGIMVRDGSALERLADIDTVIFDKTGTLTTGAIAGLLPNGAEAEMVVLSANGERMTGFRIEDRLRSGAREAFANLTKWGLRVAILSGDNASRVREIAGGLGVTHLAGARPADKLQYVSELRASGRKVLMVGDGLNDAPALMAANVSMAPASAAEIGRNAADLVSLRESLEAIPQAIEISRRASALVRQNFGLAVAYNLVAIPVAVLGHLTPLLAAVAMSLSSITVIANALRLDHSPRTDPHGASDTRQADAAPLALGSRQ
jgi:Cu2+-exporting ATPase